MATKYWTSREQHTKTKGEKLDLRSRPAKSAVIADLKQKLASAQAKLEQKKIEKDDAAVKRLQEIISSIQGTLSRQQ